MNNWIIDNGTGNLVTLTPGWTADILEDQRCIECERDTCAMCPVQNETRYTFQRGVRS